MPVTQRGRAVGRSKTRRVTPGREVAIENPVDMGYLCSKICPCKSGSTITNSLGHVLRQRCVTVGIWKDEEINQLVWRYKAEVGYSMKTNPPAPLMSARQPNRPSRFPLGAAMGQGVLTRDLEGLRQKGLLRIPDCIVLRVTGVELAHMRASGHIDWDRLIPVQRNIDMVVEIKFPGDELKPLQKLAYEAIAGKQRFRLLEASSCDCSKPRPEPKTAPERSPVTTPYTVPDSGGWLAPLPTRVPAPQPQLPQYGPVAKPNEGTPLAKWLTTSATVVGGVILVGAIVLLAPELAAGAAALLVINRAASAKEQQSKPK